MEGIVLPEKEISFKPKIDKIIEVILYLAKCDIDLTRYRIVKLVYLADVMHLNRYRRPITYDKMVAMENGPVPSTTYNILKRDGRYKIEYDKLPFDYIERDGHRYIENPKRDVNTRLFSKSDLAVLDEIVDKYGKKTFDELYDLTHEHKGYKRAWRKRGSKGNSPIRYEDLIDESEFKADLVENMRATCGHVF